MILVRVLSTFLCVFVPGCTRPETGHGTPERRDPAAVRRSEATQEPDSGRARCTVDLRDGSRLRGIPLTASVAIKAAYATIDAPLEKIRSIQLAEDGKTATITFRNGDILHGEIQAATFPIETLLGKLDVPVKTIRELQGPSATLDVGLTAYYPLDGSVTDASGHHYDGTNHGATPGKDRFGKEGGAYEVNGNGAYIGLPNGILDPAGPGFTWSLWIVCRETSGERFLLYGGMNNAESGLDFNNGKLNFAVHLENDDRGYVASVSAPIGSYTHIACVYRRGVYIQLWVNGKVASQVSVPDGVLMHGSNQHSAAIGSYAPEQPNHMRAYNIRTWLGLIDEVRIYGRPLDGPEIESLASDH